MKKQIFTLCTMLLALCSLVDAQWIIDGQQVQTLNLNVSDPQALYTDGSREITAPLAFSSSLTATSGMFRATIPWSGENVFFIIDEDEEVLKLSDGDIGFQLGSLILNQFALSQTSEGTAIDFGEHMLSGGWQIDQVLPYDEALINRGYADARYLRKDIAATTPISFDPALTATSGLFRAYIPWSDLTADLLQMDGDDECLKLSSDPNVSFQVGGITVNASGINGYGVSVGFEDNTLFGPWKLYEVTDDSKALLNRSYADARYLRSGTDLAAPLSFSSASTATSGLFRAYYDPEGQVEEFFIIDGDYECVRLGSAVPGLMVGGTYFGDGAITMGQSRIYLEDEIIEGPQWRLDQVMDNDKALINRSYADTRYLRADTPATQSIKFDQSLTATNGALQIYATDNQEHLGYFKSLSFQDGLQFSTAHSAALFFGQNSSDGLLIGPDTIMQLGYNTRIEFETGLLTGSGGAKWHVAADPTENSGIVSKGYADGRYLQRTEGITTNYTVQAGDVLVIQNGLITAINP